MVVELREGQAGILRKLCDIKANGKYTVPSELNQTYKEYLCSSGDGSSQFTLSSDDFTEWKEIVIKPVDGDERRFHWVPGTPRRKVKSATPPVSATPPDSATPSDPTTTTAESVTLPNSATQSDPATAHVQSSSLMMKFMPKFVLRWFSKQKPAGTIPTTAGVTVVVTPAATTTTAITTTDLPANSSGDPASTTIRVITSPGTVTVASAQ